MKKLLFLITILLTFAGLWTFNTYRNRTSFGAPPYIDENLNLPEGLERYPELKNWKRPEGPLRVGLQVGHYKNDELPDELSRIRESGGGTSSGKVKEWEVGLAIAQEAKAMLEGEGMVVDILPATVPVDYWADVFVSIHADGSLSSESSGFKAAVPRRDFTNKADDLLLAMEEEYGEATGLELDPNVTRNMRGYYAFSWWRFDHAVHPMTPAVILETGFLTNPKEARLLINNPEVFAEGISNAIVKFLKT